MSLYTDGTQITIPFAHVVPGQVDPSLFKAADIAYYNGPRINLANYAGEGTMPVVRMMSGASYPKMAKLGDAVHFDNNETLSKHLYSADDSISNKKLLSVRDWRN